MADGPEQSEESWKSVVQAVITNNASRLKTISDEICSHPEPAFKETHAHTVLTSFLKEEGFMVEPHYVVGTGFRASFEKTAPDDSSGGAERAGAGGGGDVGSATGRPLTLCLLCEYDASGGSHSAGHNLTSEASVAAAIAIKRCLEKNLFFGKVIILGTPGEDSGSGAKIDMIEAGAFRHVDFALMLWPLNNNIVFPKHFTLLTVDVVYKGKAAHASAFPWEGKNALDAAVACYNNVALLRQQMKPTWLINGIIKEGGVTANTIPAETKMQFWLRAPEHTDLVILQQKCTACFVAAAKATGCEVKYYFNDKMYHTMQHSKELGNIYKEHAEGLGMKFTELKEESLHTGPLSDDLLLTTMHTGSTDMGNVSQVVPSLTPAFNIGTHAFKNSQAFSAAAETDEAHQNTLKAGTALGLTAAQVMANPGLLETIRHEYTLIKSPSGNLIAHHGHLS